MIFSVTVLKSLHGKVMDLLSILGYVDPNYSSAACWVKKPAPTEEGKIRHCIRISNKTSIITDNRTCVAMLSLSIDTMHLNYPLFTYMKHIDETLFITFS